MRPPVLAVRDLVVEFRSHSGVVRAVDGVDLQVSAGRTLGLVGESGSGKTVTVLAALGLLPTGPACRVSGSALLDGRDLLRMTRRELREIRGRDVGMVFQDPMTSLHPSMRVVDQVAEALLVHDVGLARRVARNRAVELLERVGISHPERRISDYPHQWSGGMRQRAMIAMAIANGPRLLIADEPTTALDVTVQAQVLDVLRAARDEVGAATILITHNLGVVAELADDVSVMRAGRVVEHAAVNELFHAPRHAHTITLLESVPRLDRPLPVRTPPPDTAPVLQVRDLVTYHHRPGQPPVRAVDGVSLDLYSGQTLALVGESGCGKSTLARTVLRLVEPRSGNVVLHGQDILSLRGRGLRPARRTLSMVFQDPYASLNPRLPAGEIIAAPLRIAGRYRRGGNERVAELMDLVGLDRASASRLPGEFSGGQRQRIGIARALALAPQVLVLDEPVSSLDVSIQALVVALLDRLQRELGLAYLFIAHDLALVRQISDRIAVMHLGRIVESGTREQIFARPAHPYTQALLSAVPVPDPLLRDPARRIMLRGELPDASAPPSGCTFRTRCWKAQPDCAVLEPSLAMVGTGDHRSACLHPELNGTTGQPR